MFSFFFAISGSFRYQVINMAVYCKGRTRTTLFFICWNRCTPFLKKFLKGRYSCFAFFQLNLFIWLDSRWRKSKNVNISTFLSGIYCMQDTYISTDAMEQSFIDWHNILSWSGSDLMLAWAMNFIILTLFFSQKQSSFVGITPDRILSKKSQLTNSFIWKWPSANINWNKIFRYYEKFCIYTNIATKNATSIKILQSWKKCFSNVKCLQPW